MAYIGTSPSNGVRRKHTYTATASQTSFSGAGAEGVTLSYRDSNYVDVYRNGVKLGDADYTATSGTAIVLGEGAAVSDIVEIVVYDVFSVADTVSKADGGTFDGNVAMAGTLGVTGAITGTLATAAQTNITSVGTLTGFTSTGIDDNASSTAITIDSNSNLLVGTTTTNIATEGTVIYGAGSEGVMQLSSTNMTALYVNRSTDGELVQFRKGGGTTVGNITYSSATNIAIGNASKGIGIGSGSIFPTNGSTAISDAGLDLGYSSSRFKDIYLSGGAYLGGTGSANKLEDYEEGTWTASLYGSTSGAGTNVTATGNYVKVGKVATVGVYLPAMNLSSMSGSTLIGGLPFTCGGGLNTGSLTLYGFTFSGFVTPYVNNSTTVVDILDVRSNLAWAGLAIPAAAGKYVMLGITYQTA